MKKFFVAVFLIMSFVAKAQIPYTHVADNNYYIMTYHNNSTLNKGLLIRTRIPFSQEQSPVVKITGYNYENLGTIGLTIGWYGDGSTFRNITASSDGGIVPDVVQICVNDDGNIDIFLGYWGGKIRFSIAAFGEGYSEDGAWFQNWDVLDDLPNYSNYYGDARFKNQFIDVNVTRELSVNGSVSTPYLSSSSASINNLYSSYGSFGSLDVNSNLNVYGDWINGKGLWLTNKPNTDAGMAATSVVLNGRRAGGADYRWTLQTGSVGGAWGITPNGFDLWEYPNASGVNCCRPRLVVHPSEKNGINTNIAPLVINPNGAVLIGYTNPSADLSTSFMLSVKGNIKAQKLKITTTSSEWPDYVFQTGYKLVPLPDIEKFVAINKHLPDMPSAQEIDKNGLDVAETQGLLLKKLEEITLYLIEQNKQNLTQQETIESMKKEIQTLQSRIKRLQHIKK